MIEILQQIGLTSSESKVYVSLLETGKNTASGILAHASLNSGRIYDVLISLEHKGLVSMVKEGNIKYFLASPPDRVLDYMTLKMEKISEQKSSYEKILPALKKSYSQIHKDIDVQVFLGAKGQKTAYDMLFSESDKDKELIVLGITEKKRYPQDIIDMLRFYVYKRRKELKLKVKKIADPQGFKESMYSQDNSEMRYLPFTSATGIEVLGDVTMILIYSGPTITIIIKNKDVAQDYKRQLKFLWSIAKK